MKKNSRVVFCNGKLVPENEAKISIYDSSLMFGDMVFEMTRSFNNIQFKLEQHIDRLLMGIKILQIPFDYTKNQILDYCSMTIDANKSSFEDDDEHRLMIDVSRGLLDIYKNIEGLHKKSNLIIADFPLKWTVSGMGHLFDSGINAVITSQRAIPSRYLDPKIKNRNRIFYLMANIEASKMKGNNNWALLLDEHGFVAEGSGNNFFIVKDGILYSPMGKDILRGISREYIRRELCTSLKIKSVEKNIEPYDVYEADEAFMAGTPFCMLPVTSLNNIKIRNGSIGPVFNNLIKKWSENTGVDIIKQIKKWNKFDKSTALITPYKFQKK